jgi:hypothetical protein
MKTIITLYLLVLLGSVASKTVFQVNLDLKLRIEANDGQPLEVTTQDITQYELIVATKEYERFKGLS